jgi:SAM-dependent methyltransferase
MTETPGAGYDRFFGVVAPALGWVPPVRYLLRRDRILALLSSRPPGRLLEVGCGAGTLMADLERMGHQCEGLETSVDALALASRLRAALPGQGQVVSEPGNWTAAFDLVAAFDVLEHIEDDDAALVQWRHWIAPGGRLVIAVPAHSSRWGPGDVWAGHFRRYDAAGLRSLLERHGFVIEHFECYGFPLANLSEWLGRGAYQKMLDRGETELNRSAATARSGIDRAAWMRPFMLMSSWPGRLALRMAFVLQRWFSRTDLGSGYLVAASLR